ncbi:hypothetical protein [Ichthyenterobacterium magnum]|uniref:DUF4138 domain-containing protein n=1 Tax=Ichthyenterobacterium magnum TaxID=1230530 RepID=A0A420DV26_9FLAO|nr:hypothetical protein [Ichthyenterobacterium magnum]RKE98095.1 hypothetical protein BXY80_0166 [Ichthyenterobacterium magnum]
MRIYLRLFFAVLFFMLYNKVSAQEDYALLEPNVNVRANGITHYLNKTKDTLLLKSDKMINKVYAVNMKYEREVDTKINANSYKVPLTELSKGKHVFVVVQSPLRIVFVVRVLQNNTRVLDTDVKLTALQNEE